MSKYSRLLRQRVEKYDKVYKNNTNKTALKLIWWNLQWSLLKSKKQHSSPYKGEKIKIAIALPLNSGVGDILMQSTYVKELIRYLNDEKISVDILFISGEESVHGLFFNAMYVDRIVPYKQSLTKKYQYNLVLHIQRFISLDYIDWDGVKNSPKLNAYCLELQNFYNENGYIINNSPYSDALSISLAKLQKKNRNNQMDILGILQMNQDTTNFMDLNPEYFNILEKNKLQDCQYITIQRGQNHTYSGKPHVNVRSWPVEYYDEFIKIFKKNYPNILVVQMGFSEDSSFKFSGVDVDLRGKTNFEELKIILKYSVLHIDSEGGYAHIKHFLNTRSVVIYGPTDMEFYGYPDNINIKNDSCPIPCEWITTNWTQECARGYSKPTCMYDTRPKQVLTEVKNYLENRENYFYSINKYQEIEQILLEISHDKKVAVILDKQHGMLEATSQLNKTLFGLNKNRDSNVEYSGVYNISAKDLSFDIVFSSIEEHDKSPIFILMDLLRILKPNGLLILKENNLSWQEMEKIGITQNLYDVNSNVEGVWVIKKHEEIKKNND